MKTPSPATRYTVAEELANSLTHAVGTLLSIAALAVLVFYTIKQGSIWHITSASIFGASLTFLYVSSTCYHLLRHPQKKARLRIFDHIAILLLIAGTYTPFTLITLHGAWGWSLFAAVWALAISGIFIEFSQLRYRRQFSIALYVAMGWMIVMAIKPLLDALPSTGFILLLGGGLSYTLGINFYLWRRLPYHHAIWHLFVLAGSILHFYAVFLYVLPKAV
ncbi:hemolysin III family protein [Desulfuromonas acetoxidans]|uniref:Channel protein, hemolysin III family n=1 Tax=Desulfuromonas acetoxidans (strain DSM 684 / 11070) TaxID=281689 RepID=Q1JVY4_DESA6|nr:hemolysin III family protein [Desulfuromonas acetoxidans]EAT14421.1 channel protein, hemolysin III family [Desulfuromonas acetoxidans DSM 684]MBF0647007.1 hemolysin III family protein [Desulfuromonas acetoxidans]NVD26010.1 hemolysin III family protein [Desulfuromonas acetoxidans]NVE16974.1 hemolysin III family protein [Desulfuromonas acetoxidans]